MCERVYGLVRERVEGEIRELLRVRDADPDSGVLPRLRRGLDKLNPFSA